jgi:3-methyladenine DNA glycosylase AlkC
VPSPLKAFFGPPVLARIASEVGGAFPAFPRRAFLADAAAGLDALELLDRGRHIAAALRRHLPSDPAEAIGILESSLGPPLERTEGNGMAPFAYLPHAFFVRTHGLACFEVSMRAQHALTQRFTAEWSLRPFLAREPARTLAVLETWTRDESPHVRRLVSEGTRPRLPWAERLTVFRDDPTPVLRLLERLRDDPHPYVRRSVANHLNDLGKDDPALLVRLASRWLEDAPPARRHLVRHALRTAVKRGDPAALRALGFGPAPAVRATKVRISPARPRIGDDVRIDFEIVNPSRRPVDVVVDLGVHFVKASGATAPKVFKVRALRLEPGARIALGKTISLAQHSTRTHRPGRHVVDVRLNGRVVPGGVFHLRA